jgi:HKD family nuclease
MINATKELNFKSPRLLKKIVRKQNKKFKFSMCVDNNKKNMLQKIFIY